MMCISEKACEGTEDFVLQHQAGGTRPMATARKTLGLMLAICSGLVGIAPRTSAQVIYDRALYTKPAACNVSPGTIITKQNWMQYRDCFSVGVQHFWQGDLAWKMPDDVQIRVGPQHPWTLPKPYVEATE